MRSIFILIFIIAISIAIGAANPVPEPRKLKTTADRIQKYGYPSEEHTVQTSDAYILKMFRIPYSPKLQNENVQKPVIFLQHGLLSSSDSWILNGPDNALAYNLADAGYDVWMGNARGNIYSKKHVHLTPLLPSFWDFSWHEIGLYDLPAMIDYVLYKTGEEKLHYVGHSQGSTTFMVLLSTIPRYNKKFKTTHMLAPVAFMENMRTPFAKIGGPLMGHPSMLVDLMGHSEFMPNNKFISMFDREACRDQSILQEICGNVYFLIAGWQSRRLNFTLLSDIVDTHPAGSSTSQLIHYLQEYNSGSFRQYDHGRLRNKKLYGNKTPPEYVINNIKPEVPIEFYYGDSDNFASVIDVERMAARLGDNVKMYNIKYTDWGHLDFMWAMEAKEVVNDRILDLANKYESRFLFEEKENISNIE